MEQFPGFFGQGWPACPACEHGRDEPEVARRSSPRSCDGSLPEEAAAIAPARRRAALEDAAVCCHVGCLRL